MAGCWSLWLERNRTVIEDKEEPLEDVWSRLKNMVAWWILNHKYFKNYALSHVSRSLGVML